MAKIRILILLVYILSIQIVNAEDFSFNVAFNKRTLYNGEALIVTPTVRGYNHNVKFAIIYKVKYSWDGQSVSTLKKTPFTLGYELWNQSIGEHELKVEITVEDGGLKMHGPFVFKYPVTIAGSLQGVTKAMMQEPSYMMNLAEKLYKGNDGYPRDIDQAIYWLQKCEDNNPDAAFRLYEIMLAKDGYVGTIALNSKTKAKQMYEKEVKRNPSNYKAWLNLGLLSSSYERPLNCFEMASKSSDKAIRREACYQIGLLYEEGDIHTDNGVLNADIDIAKSWYRKSANDGYDKAIAKLKQLEGPRPNPNQDVGGLPQLSWLSGIDVGQDGSYILKIGINSKSNLENATVYLDNNVITARGITAVVNDGFIQTLERKLILHKGNNLIKVTVRNAAGTTTIEKNITY